MGVSFGRHSIGLARLAAALMIGVLGVGCGGGGTATSPVSAIPPSSKGTAKVTFTMKWAAPASSSSAQRSPKFIPATASSVSVTINGGIPQFLNAPATTMTIDAPVGTDTFSFATFDTNDGQGNVLSRTSVTKLIVSGAANSVTAVLNGVVASFTMSLSNPAPNAGVPATVNVNVSATDADGDTIVGPGNFSTPIHLTINDPDASGTLSLSTLNIINAATTATLAYTGGTLTSASVVASATGVPSAAASFTPRPTFYQFSIPTAAQPQWIAPGSDGNMWFTERSQSGGKVARITPAGVVTEFAIPTPNVLPNMIIGASDGNLWFAEDTATTGTGKLAKVTTTGTFTEFSAPSGLFGLVDRGDGNIWYVTQFQGGVGFQSINSSNAGNTTIGGNGGTILLGITTAPDDNLYFTDFTDDKIGRISNLSSPAIAVGLTPGTGPESIVRGPDGNLWFTESITSKIGRLSPNSFSVTGEFATLTTNSEPAGITVGHDGALWFTESTADRIGRITTDGTVTEFMSPITGLNLLGIAVAPDGSLWFCEPGIGNGTVGRLVY